jgi:(p)ppGpp synthase/HD superfamily hydrolase
MAETGRGHVTGSSGAEETENLWQVSDRLFFEDTMTDWLREIAAEQGYEETLAAMDYARHQHEGQFRKASRYSEEQVPYINHPLMMACHAYALGLADDGILSVCLLHDVCEDCEVAPDDLPFSEGVRHAVALLTRHPGQFPTPEEEQAHYYEGIQTDRTASIVKVLDRCSNVSTMALAFTDERLQSYIDETEDYILPLLDFIRETYPEYRRQTFLLRYHILSVINSLKGMIMR